MGFKPYQLNNKLLFFGHYMKKTILITALFATVSVQAEVLKSDISLISIVSNALKSEQYTLVLKGDDKPRFSTEGGYNNRAYTFKKSIARPSAGLFVISIYEQSLIECVNTEKARGEENITLINSTPAHLSSPSLQGGNARDYLNFSHKGMCYEISYGQAKSNKSKIISIANTILNAAD